MHPLFVSYFIAACFKNVLVSAPWRWRDRAETCNSYVKTVSVNYETVHVIRKYLELATEKFTGHFGGKILYCILLTRHKHISYLDLRYSYVYNYINSKTLPKNGPLSTWVWTWSQTLVTDEFGVHLQSLKTNGGPNSSPYLFRVQKPTLLPAWTCQNSTDTRHYRFLRDYYQFILSTRYFTPT